MTTPYFAERLQMLQADLTCATSWKITNEGLCELAFLASGAERKTDSVLYTLEDFESLDKRFKVAINFLNALPAFTGSHPAYLLRFNLDHWREPGPEVVKQTNTVNNLVESYRVHEIKELSSRLANGDFNLSVQFYTVANIDGVDVVNFTSSIQKTFGADWLETYYPGFVKRWEIGMSLQLDPVQLADYASNVNASVSNNEVPSLPDNVS